MAQEMSEQDEIKGNLITIAKDIIRALKGTDVMSSARVSESVSHRDTSASEGSWDIHPKGCWEDRLLPHMLPEVTCSSHWIHFVPNEWPLVSTLYQAFMHSYSQLLARGKGQGKGQASVMSCYFS